MPKSFNYPLVVLSVLVAVFVSNTALSLFLRVARAQKHQGRLWLWGGAMAMGAGIWATHFLGMLALRLPVRLTYDTITTAVSLGIAMVASLFALSLAAQSRPGTARLFCSACLLGGGIAAMHYCGMAAIQIVPMIEYAPLLVSASIVTAVAGSFLALCLLLKVRGPRLRRVVARGAAACVLGLSIGGMHYMGVFGSTFSPGSYCLGGGGADNQWLAVLIATVAFAVMAVVSVLLVYDSYLNSRTREYHKHLEQANAQLQHAATHDALTGLPNRLSLARELDLLIQLAADGGRRFAVMLIDLDRFKEINDSLGHLAGDELLSEVSARIRAQVRAGTVLARLGGDEFVVVVDHLRDGADAEAVATRLQRAIAMPMTLCDIPVHISASIGIAEYPKDGTDSSTLLQHADSAMYHVKNNGRAGHQLYSNEIHSPSRERLLVDDALRRALTAQEFELHYQPKVDVRTGSIEGAEALIRWRHRERGLVPPAEFIPLAEETGLIAPIGEWALWEVGRQVRQWQRSGIDVVPVAVNVSAKQFESRDFADTVARVVFESGLPPGLLELELTESAVMRSVESSIDSLRRLTQLGIAIALDDFGTGYSSLSHLRRLPLHKLKIDRSFIQELGTDPGCAQIVRAIVALAHNLQLRVIAEGVETAQQLQFLREVGCDKYQGYYFSRPVPADDFARLLTSNRVARPSTPGLVAMSEALTV